MVTVYDGDKDRYRIYVYKPVHTRLLVLKANMEDERGGRQVSLDMVIESLLDKAGMQEEQGA